MPIIIVLLLLGAAVVYYVLFIMKTAENDLLQSFYAQVYHVQVMRRTVDELDRKRLGEFIDWIIDNPSMSYVYVEKRLSKTGMKILDRYARSIKFDDFEHCLDEERERKGVATCRT